MQILKGYHEFIKLLNEAVSGPVRVRFAPSPTGPLHMGGVRTALYNYLFAKKHNGTNYLRIEDTDQTRFVPGAEEYIIRALDWCGIEFDEGPHIGGDYGPYKQSERMDIYAKYIQELLDNGKAYYAFDTAEELDAAREKTQHFQYDAKTRGQMRNSLALPPEEVQRLIDEGVPYVVRVKYPDQPIDITVDDLVRGRVTMNSALLDDKVLMKTDGLPTYHMANIVDDHLMKTTHVLRGEEWLPSVPLHAYLYDCFGWQRPEFAHMALILKPEGPGKLSKRDGAKFGFPVFPLEWKTDSGEVYPGYKEDGYLPEGFINLIAFLGWNPGTDKEVYSMDELIRDFSLERLNKAGARFNPKKALWFNAQHIKEASNDRLADAVRPILDEKGYEIDDEKLDEIIGGVKNRVSLTTELWPEISFYFEPPKKYDEKAVNAKWRMESPKWIEDLKHIFMNTRWNATDIQNAFQNYVTDNDLDFGFVSTDLRLVLTGQGGGPSMFDIMDFIGKEATLDRMSNYDIKPVAKSYLEDIKKPAKSGGGGADAAEIARIEKEIDTTQKYLDGIRNKLANPKFVERAPEAVVAKEKEKESEAMAKLDDLNQQLSNMSAPKANPQEVEKLKKDLESARGYLVGIDKKLANPNFVQRAPEAVVAAEKEKRVNAEATIAELEARLRELGA